MATAVSWLVGSVLMFVGCGVVGASALGSRRRSPFYLRLMCATAAMTALAFGLAVALNANALPQQALGAAWMALLLAALAVAPVFCYQGLSHSPGLSEDEDGDGPGSGPPPPPSDPPRGGAPLPDADQSRTRRRDHTRPRLHDDRRRRPAVEPVRPAPRPSRR